mgnify:FL=1
MVAWGPIIASVGSAVVGSMMDKGSSPQQTAAGQMKQDDRLTDMLIAENNRRRQELAKPGEAEQPDWLQAIARQWVEYEAAAKRRNPDAEDVYADLLQRSKQQMADRIEDQQFGVEA